MEDKHLQKILDEVVRHQYWKNSFKEAESMVRKAETLNDVVELKLSSRTRRQVEKRFGTDMELMVKVGRQEALSNDMHPEYIDEDPKYIQELIRSLDEAGFIRHDLYPRTWNVWGLYNAIFNYYSLAIGEVSLASLANRETFTYSKEYESMPAVSDEAFGELMTALGSLTEREQMILVLRFGLDDEKPRPTEMVGRMLGVTRERVRQIEGKALRKMRAPGCLCKLPALFGFIPPVEPEPKNCFSADGTIDIDADIRDLNLSVRAYNCLKRFAYINTVEDILNYPKEDWPKIKNLGHKALLEIQDRMHAVGYPGFSITTLS